MLTHPTLDQLHRLGLFGMAKAFGEAASSGEAAALTHPEWLGLLLDREMTYRHDKKLTARLRYAHLRQQAAVEDVDYRAARGLDRALFHKLVSGDWIDAHDNLICERPTRRHTAQFLVLPQIKIGTVRVHPRLMRECAV